MPPRKTRTLETERARPSVVLFDTYSIVFRAYHALPSLSTVGQEPTSALYGACSLIIKVLREQRPTRFAFAVDAPRPTFRHERYAEYKAQRPRASTELVRQLDRLPVLLRAFEAPVWCVMKPTTYSRRSPRGSARRGRRCWS
jgi:DNA polymerase-1